ncbi:MAG: sulfatase-like hydrolase/transferase [Bacteroidetes bacterium]|nr:sulfatase-like hydrolase/transferase [Bacteroidota bacterium]
MRTLILIALSLGLGNCFPAQATPSDQPANIIFILVDDLGWCDLECYGSDFYETPNIDQLAFGGVRFTNAYSAHPVCSPTRSSIATGKYPARLHVTAYIPGKEKPYDKLSHPADWTKYLKMSETTYAEVLREHGYKTFHSGKWHLGQLSPLYHGFDVVDNNLGHSAGTDDPKNDLRYTLSAMDFIEENKDSLFLAVISHNTVHVPLETRQELEDKYNAKEPGSFGQDNAVMAGMIESLDQSVGLLMDKLEDLELLDKTYIVFLSDNGGLKTATSNLPLRGGKSQCYEGGIRVPFIVKGPGLPGNRQVSYPAISNDLFPTMLSMAGIGPMPEAHMDGISLMPLLTADSTELVRENLFFHYPHYQSLPPHSAVRSGDWKLIEHHEDGNVELFDLDTDPGELNNLAATHTEKRDELLQLLHDHLSEIGAQLPAPNPDYDPARENESQKGEMDPEELLQTEYLNWGIDRSGLRDAINAARQHLDTATVGSMAGEYSPEVFENATNAIISAQIVLDTSSDQSVIDAALETLLAEMASFLPRAFDELDLAALQAALDSAREMIDSVTIGNGAGEYSQAVFEMAINAIIDVQNVLDTATIQSVLDAALDKFNAEMANFVPNTTGIYHTDIPGVIIYPNPVYGKICINAENAGGYKIFNIGSTMLICNDIDNNIIDVSVLPEGFYLIQIEMENGTVETERFFKR